MIIWKSLWKNWDYWLKSAEYRTRSKGGDRNLTTDNLDPNRRSSHEIARLVRILSEQFYISTNTRSPYGRDDIFRSIRAIYEGLRTHQPLGFQVARRELEIILRHHAPTAANVTINQRINYIVIELERFVSYRNGPSLAVIRHTTSLQQLIRRFIQQQRYQAQTQIDHILWTIETLQAVIRARSVRARI